METPWAWQELWVILLKSHVSWSCLIYCILSILDLCSIYQIDILYTIFIYYRLLFDVSKIFFWYRSRSRNTPVMILRDDSPGKLDVVGWMHLVLPQRVYPNIPQHCNVGTSWNIGIKQSGSGCHSLVSTPKGWLCFIFPARNVGFSLTCQGSFGTVYLVQNKEDPSQCLLGRCEISWWLLRARRDVRYFWDAHTPLNVCVYICIIIYNHMCIYILGQPISHCRVWGDYS